MPLLLPCPICNPCEEATPPYTNLSAELPDTERFIGINFGPTFPPPINTTWFAWGCIGICISHISQADADACAARQAVECTVIGGPPPGPGPRPPVQLYSNDAQSCTGFCPDGTPYSFVIPAGTYESTSKLKANNIAHSFACQYAAENKHCPPTNSCCANQPLSSTYDTFRVRGIIFGNPSFRFDVTSGSLPPGTSIVKTGPLTARLSGTPTTPGVYNFIVTASTFGWSISYADKVYVLGVTGTTLPSGTEGVAYSTQITYAGNKGIVTFTPGAFFPSWAALSSTGLITGTPPVVGSNTNYQFEVSFQDT